MKKVNHHQNLVSLEKRCIRLFGHPYALQDTDSSMDVYNLSGRDIGVKSFEVGKTPEHPVTYLHVNGKKYLKLSFEKPLRLSVCPKLSENKSNRIDRKALNDLRKKLGC